MRTQQSLRRLSFGAGMFLLLLWLPGTIRAQSPKRISEASAMEAATAHPQPAYPPMARQLHMQGAVEVDAFIDEDGSVEHTAPVTGNPVLTKAAEAALKHWKFSPFKTDGKAVKVVSTITFNFKL